MVFWTTFIQLWSYFVVIKCETALPPYFAADTSSFATSRACNTFSSLYKCRYRYISRRQSVAGLVAAFLGSDCFNCTALNLSLAFDFGPRLHRGKRWGKAAPESWSHSSFVIYVSAGLRAVLLYLAGTLSGGVFAAIPFSIPALFDFSRAISHAK